MLDGAGDFTDQPSIIIPAEVVKEKKVIVEHNQATVWHAMSLNRETFISGCDGCGLGPQVLRKEGHWRWRRYGHEDEGGDKVFVFVVGDICVDCHKVAVTTERWLIHVARLLRTGEALERRKEVEGWGQRTDQPRWSLWWNKEGQVKLTNGEDRFPAVSVDFDEEEIGQYLEDSYNLFENRRLEPLDTLEAKEEERVFLERIQKHRIYTEMEGAQQSVARE